MTITLKIDNIDTDFNLFPKKRFVYKKKDPRKHMGKIEYIDDGADLSDVKPYAHVEDSAEYVHNLRRQRR